MTGAGPVTAILPLTTVGEDKWRIHCRQANQDLTEIAVNFKQVLTPILVLAGIAYGAVFCGLWAWQTRLIFEAQADIPYTPEDYHLPYEDDHRLFLCDSVVAALC